MNISNFALATLAAMLVLGCQQPGVNDPGTAINGTAVSKPEPAVEPNSIEFDQTVVYTNADGSQTPVRAVGRIHFAISKLPILSQELYDVSLSVKGELYPEKGDLRVWSFGDASTDRISIPGSTKVSLKKWYEVRGTENPTAVVMLFTVLENTLLLRSMELVPIKKGPDVVSDIN